MKRLTGAFAAAAGFCARLIVLYGVGVAAAACIVIGAALIYVPAAWLAAGGLLLLLDRKVPS